MGMFDTFHIQHRERRLALQSKQFARVPDDYHLVDFEASELAPPECGTVWVGDHNQDWRDPACRVEWIALSRLCELEVIEKVRRLCEYRAEDSNGGTNASV